jgi:CheY-like chemotaxis protein
VGNAIKFTSKGQISIKLETQALETEQNHRRLFFEISDTGIGISPEDIDRIFQPFAQIGYHEGTGLGLSITRRYVELLGGTISAASEPGRGSTFSFTISYNSVDHNNIQITPVSAGRVIGIENASDYRILIVEDQMENRMLLRNLLSPFGFQISEAADGREGIQIFEQWRPHMIFIDRRMPVLDGLQAVSNIRKISAPVRPVIIAVTAHAFKEERQEMLDAGCDGFIAKPFTAEDIFFSLENYLHVNLIRAEDNAQGAPGALPASAIAGLPKSLRLDLEAALVRLDIDLIGELIKKIAALNPDLGNALEQFAGRFDFKPILKTLQRISDEKHEQP